MTKSSFPMKKSKAAFKAAKDEFSYQLDEAEFSNAAWDRRKVESRQAINLNPSIKNVNAVIANSGLDSDKKLDEGGSANVPLTSLIKLMENAGENLELPAPAQFLVNASTYKIVTDKGFARFTMKFGLRILEDGWVSIPLLTHRAAVVTSNVTRTGEEKRDNKETGPKTWSFCVLPGGKDSTQGLLSNVSGDFVVDVEALVPYANLRETGLLLSVPKCVNNELFLDVAGTQLDIKVEPAISSELAVSEEQQRTKLKCRLPPTNRLMLQWTEKLVELDSEPAVKEHLPLTITSEQYVLHSIGEGVLSSKIVMKYVIQNGSVSLFEIVIDSRVRLLNVLGAGLKRWEVVEQEYKDPNAAPPVATEDPAKKVKRPNRVLKAYMDYGMEDAYELTINTELAMGDTSAKVVIPTQRSLGVSREKGHVGLEARTNVELQEIQARGLATTDVGELPQTVMDLASNAVLLGYKYLDPSFQLEVDVKKHGDVGVLIAIVEECQLDVTVTEEGSMLTRLSAKVRNTQKQFLRIKLPTGAHIWSTFSANQPVKPAFDEKDKALMVPLHKSKLGDNGGSFVVEVVYLYEASPMGNRGTFEFRLPTLDIPANLVKVLLHLPNEFRFGEFEGDLKETQDRYLVAMTGTLNISQPMRTQMNPLSNVQQQQMQMQSNAFLEDNIDAVQTMNDYAGEFNKVKGVLPVRVDRMNISGTQAFSFERALIGSDVPMSLIAPYKKVNTKGCCRRRRVGGCSLM